MTSMPDPTGMICGLLVTSAVSMAFGALITRAIGDEIAFAVRRTGNRIISLLKGER